MYNFPEVLNSFRAMKYLKNKRAFNGGGGIEHHSPTTNSTESSSFPPTLSISKNVYKLQRIFLECSLKNGEFTMYLNNFLLLAIQNICSPF